jgi:HEPN domain-containing protein
VLRCAREGETRLWIEQAESDLRTASVVFGQALHRQCIFHGQQAIELILKAIWIERTECDYPRTHNLAELIRQLGLEVSEETLTFLGRLSRQYTASRYPELDVAYPKEAGEYYLLETQDVFRWLRQQLS